MKIFTKTIKHDASMHIYVMTHQGSKKWRRTFFACIDHEIISPVIERWRLLRDKKKNPLAPKLFEVIVGDDVIVESNYSDDDSKYKNGCVHAEKLVVDLLSLIKSENDLFALLMDKDYNWAYPNLVSNDLKVMAGAVIFSVTEKLEISEAIGCSEKYFSRELPAKTELLQYVEKKKITHFKDFS